MLGLFTRDLQSSFFSCRREGLDLEGLLRGRKLDLRERLDVKAPGWRLGGLGRRVDKRALKVKGIGVYLQRKPPIYLRSNFDLGFPLGLYLDLNLIQLDLRLDINFYVAIDLQFALGLGLDFGVGSTWESGLT